MNKEEANKPQNLTKHFLCQLALFDTRGCVPSTELQ